MSQNPSSEIVEEERKKGGTYVPPHRRRRAAAEASPSSTPPTRHGHRPHPPLPYASGYHRRPPPRLPPHAQVYGINLAKRPDKWASLQAEARKVGLDVVRYEAVDGAALVSSHACNDNDQDDENENYWTDFVQMEWDATRNAQYDPHRVTPGRRTLTPGEVGCALSHVQLWQRLLRLDDNDANDERVYWILEDDVMFDHHLHRHARRVWDHVPTDWGILYWGFSSRGPRDYVFQDDHLAIYRPTYGFHAHAYWITREAAAVLCQHLPVVGPIDVWLADHEWFDIPTYCVVVPGRGWYDDATQQYEGLNLVRQKKRQLSSDIAQSAAVERRET